MSPRHQNKAGFTRLDLAAALAGLGLAAIIALPALATNVADSHRSVCANNLRQLGVGVLRFTGDFGGAIPWRVTISSGGTFFTPKAGNAWFKFLIFSNDVSPRVITCPADMSSDPTIRVSSDWKTFSTNQQKSTSYQVALDINAKPAGEAELVFADRNTAYDGGPASCSSGINNAMVAGSWPEARFGWTNAVHGLSGHVLQMSGSVEFADTARLRKVVISEIAAPGIGAHMVKAR